MEAIAALRLACNIIQVVDAGCKVATTVTQAYQMGTTEINEILFSAAQGLTDATLTLQKSIDLPATQDDDNLWTMARECAGVAKQLKQKVAPSSQPSDRWRDKLKQSFRTIRNKSTVDELAAKLKSYREVLDTQILVDIRSRVDITALNQQDGFSNLELTIRDFIQQQAEIQREYEETRQVVVDKISAELQATQPSNDEKMQYEKLISSLTFANMNDRKNRITIAHTKTCEWILRVKVDAKSIQSNESGDDKLPDAPNWDSFVEWLRGEQSLYWISGKPGSGKSTLMHFICHHESTQGLLQRWAAPQEVFLLSAYLWNAGSEEQKSLRGLLATLLVQALRKLPHLEKSLMDRHSGLQHKSNYSDWSYSELKDTLIFLIQEAPTKFCIFIDGLDEAHISPRDPQDTLLQLIQHLSGIDGVKCCVSSRPYKQFEDAFRGKPKLRLQDLNAGDVDRVFRDKLRPVIRNAGMILIGHQAEDLEYEFRRKAQGVFLWAHLAIESLKRGLDGLDSFDELQKRLDSLPSELEDLYERMFTEHSQDSAHYQEEAARYFRLLLLDYDPLGDDLSVLRCTFSMPQNGNLRKAAMEGVIHPQLLGACSKTSTRIRTCCAGLLEVAKQTWTREDTHTIGEADALYDMRTTTIQFIHRTARDFLLTTRFGQQLIACTSSTDNELYQSVLEAVLCQISISSKPETLSLLECLLLNVRNEGTSEDHISMLQAIETTFDMKFRRSSDSLNSTAWYTSLSDPFVRGETGNRLLFCRRVPLDLLTLTVSSGHPDLANLNLENTSRRVNPAYAQYSLFFWNPWRFRAEALRVGYWTLGLTLLQLLSLENGSDTSGNFDINELLYFPDLCGLAIRSSLAARLYLELWQWIQCDKIPDEDEALRLFYFQLTALKLDMDSSMFLGAQFDRQTWRLQSMVHWRATEGELLIECNVMFILKCISQHHNNNFEDAMISDIRARLGVSNIKSRFRVLCLDDWLEERRRNSITKIKENDSTELADLLEDMMMKYGEYMKFENAPPAVQMLLSATDQIWKRGKDIDKVDKIEYLKEIGYYKDIDDPDVMRHPPPMYLDDDEVVIQDQRLIEGDDSGELHSLTSDHYDTEDELFDVDEGRRS